MDPRNACGCHEDYHELGVHRPGYALAPAAQTEAADGVAPAGAA
ncbi:hypothetical protein SFC88_16390 [Nocardioides sp. HM23]|nr:hypothetical protein [Nocardioides sp. HM23]MDZ5622424.1 hypothetical protein [Nocardioides sp. HM23]